MRPRFIATAPAVAPHRKTRASVIAHVSLGSQVRANESIFRAHSSSTWPAWLRGLGWNRSPARPDKSKLSKRKNPDRHPLLSRDGLSARGAVNFLALLANAAREGEDELMDLPAIVRRFELEHVPIGGPVFDVAKLDWLNAPLHSRAARRALVRASALPSGRSARAPDAHRASRGAAHRAAERPRPALGVSFSGRIALRARGSAEREARRRRDAPSFHARAVRPRRVAGVERRRRSRRCSRRRRAARQEAARRRAAVLRRHHRAARRRFRSTTRWSCSAATSCANACATRSTCWRAKRRRVHDLARSFWPPAKARA